MRNFVIALLIVGAAAQCSTFNDLMGCKGQSITNPDDWSNRVFQTPPRGHPLWRDTFQDYNALQGYVRMTYNQAKTQVTLNFTTKLNPKIFNGKSYTLYYVFGTTKTTNPIFTVKSGDIPSGSTLPVACYAYAADGSLIASLVLDELDFIWNHPAVNQPPQYKNGQKGAIVELFGWPYADIEKECEFLGKSGYMGVKVFPPNEAILNFNGTENGELNPWWFIYQPVSYRLYSRMGTYQQLRSMINTCRAAGVRVYADAVVNHMSGSGNDAFPSHRTGNCVYWPNKNSSAGSPWYTHSFQWEFNQWSGTYPGNEFPAVPYGPLDFHCERSLNSWTDPLILNAGWLVGLVDLNTESDYVRTRIADYFTQLLSVGFSGFRIDAAKHISPDNLAAIFSKFKQNLGGGELPDDFITYLEVIIGGEKDLLMCQQSSYNYGPYLASALKNAGLSDGDVYKVKIWESDYPKEFPLCDWPIPSERYAAQNECHDDQVPGSSSRDMGDKGSILVKEKNVPKHRDFEKQLFTRTDGNWQIKLVLSSYTFRESVGAYGFPDGSSDCTRCQNETCKKQCTKSMPYVQAYNPNSCGYDVYGPNGGWQEGVYTRVHRDKDIINAMRQWMGLPKALKASDIGLPSHCDNRKFFDEEAFLAATQ